MRRPLLLLACLVLPPIGCERAAPTAATFRPGRYAASDLTVVLSPDTSAKFLQQTAQKRIRKVIWGSWSRDGLVVTITVEGSESVGYRKGDRFRFSYAADSLTFVDLTGVDGRVKQQAADRKKPWVMRRE